MMELNKMYNLKCTK